MKEAVILIVDDFKPNRQLLSVVLQNSGHYIIEASNGEDALYIAEKQKLSLIILDIVMPGIDGFEVCRRLKSNENTKEIPVIFISALNDQKTIQKVFEVGGVDYVSKPFIEMELLARVSIHIDNYLMKNTLSKQNKKLKKQIKKREKAEILLQESLTNYKELIDGMNETAWVIGFDGQVIEVNKSAEDVLGYTHDELLEIGILGIDATHSKAEIEAFATIMPNDIIQKFETKHKTKDGKVFPVEIVSSLVTYQGKQAILSIARDITHRKKTLEELQIERLLLRTLIDNLPDAIYVKDLKAQKILANRADLKIMGIESEAACIGKTDMELFDPVNGKRGYDEDLLVLNSGKALVNMESQYTDKEMNTRYRTASKFPLFDKDKNIIGLIGIGRDISEQKLMTHELIVAKEKAEESDRLKTSFLANMSHEIRTPMNSIMGFASLLPDTDNKEQINQYSEIIMRNSEQLVRIIDDIVLYSRLQTGLLYKVPTKFSACDLINDIKQSFNLPKFNERGIKLITENFVGQICYVQTDYEKLRQIFTNLVSNAFKYTNSGSITIGIDQLNNQLHFFVKDTGIGISSDEIEKVFERFYRGSNVTKSTIGGTGLGLSIVKEMVELLGGKIWIESELDKGTTFWFTIA
jgi:PAS domain S-box-containing protein